MAYTYRTVKGDVLTYSELDENFRYTDELHDNVAESEVIAVAKAQVAVDAAIAAGLSADDANTDAGLAQTAALQASKLNLGPKATAPTLDNQGDALLAGATYYDTALNKWQVWSGSAWAEGLSAVAGVSKWAGKTGEVTPAVSDIPTLELSLQRANPAVVVITTTTTAAVNTHYVVAAAGITLTAPATFAEGDYFGVSEVIEGSAYTLNFGSTKVRGEIKGSVSVDAARGSFAMRYKNATQGLV